MWCVAQRQQVQNLQNPFVNDFDLVQSAYDTLSSANSRWLFLRESAYFVCRFCGSANRCCRLCRNPQIWSNIFHLWSFSACVSTQGEFQYITATLLWLRACASNRATLSLCDFLRCCLLSCKRYQSTLSDNSFLPSPYTVKSCLVAHF